MVASTMHLSDYNFSTILLNDQYRNKSSFTAELSSLIIDKILPIYCHKNDAINLLQGGGIDFLGEMEKHIANPNYEIEIWESLALRIRADAEKVFNDLANIINGEQQNTYIKKRLDLLEMDTVYLSGAPSSINQRAKIGKQLENLETALSKIRSSYGEHGTHIQLTYRVEKMFADITRGKQLLQLADENLSSVAVMKILRSIIRANKRRHGVREFVKGKLRLVLFQIVEHNSKSGDKYIASNGEEYFELFYSSLIGGLLISIFALFKIKLDSLGMPLLEEGILFGMNYTLCFVLVDMLGGVIATKQPAMTANTLTRILGPNNKKNSLSPNEFSWLVADASNSQFISLVGNVVVAWILATVFSQLYWSYYGHEIVDYFKAKKLLELNNIFQSGAIFYAGIAGVFLSLSGLISGYVSNAILYYQLNERIKEKYKFRPHSYRVAQYFSNRLSKFVGSGALGFFLGMSGAIGMFSGLPLDIRHVAFSSAHIGYGEASLHATWSLNIGMQMLISILVIGLVNFVISFHLTTMVAMRVRQISFPDIRRGFLATLVLFIKRPWVFLAPVGFYFRETKQ